MGPTAVLLLNEITLNLPYLMESCGSSVSGTQQLQTMKTRGSRIFGQQIQKANLRNSNVHFCKSNSACGIYTE